MPMPNDFNPNMPEPPEEADEPDYDAELDFESLLATSLRACVEMMTFYTDMTPELEFHNEWRAALENAETLLSRMGETRTDELRRTEHDYPDAVKRVVRKRI